MSSVSYDPFDPQVLSDPYPYYAALRRAAPVYPVASLDLKVVSRHADAEQVLRRPDLFSSSPYRDFIRAAMELGGVDPELGSETLLGSDPPCHTRLRKIVNRGFMHGRVAALAPTIQKMADTLVSSFVETGEGDFVSGVAGPLPVMVIAAVLGVEPERHRDFKRWSDHMILATTGVLNEEEKRGLVRSFEEMNTYVDQMVARRRRRPTDDLISALIRAEASEEVMRAAEVKTFVQLLLIAGNEATTHLIANSVLALTARPTRLARIAADPMYARAFVEETMRHDAPVQMILRRAAVATVIADTEIVAGEAIGVLLGSANRDDRRFAHAERFDPEREAGGQLGVGAGIHFCLGADLARLEGEIALGAMARAVSSIERLDEKLEYPTTFLVRGPKRLAVKVEPRRAASALRA
jgi:cytochrome P450